MNNQKAKHKNNKGITLVALIITIIVLLILAVVAIGAIKNDGIIDYAKNAKRDYMAEADRENQLLQNALAYINDNVPGQENSGNGDGAEQEPGDDGTDVQPEPTVIVVGGTEDKKLKDGETFTLTLQTTEGVNVPVTNYESSAPTIATVNASGVVRGEAPGTATITLTYKVNETTKTKTYDVSVVENVTDITITDNGGIRPEFGYPIQLTVTTSPTVNSTGTITYESLDTNVATVDNNGYVTTLSQGTARINIKYTPQEGAPITKEWTAELYADYIPDEQ